ncbi:MULTISPECIES: hypothetical protein [unclassified Streptomyces]|uniref:hypothetical protein n=1 Tax=unclassified Streptomyces TaxID=2593676 RepID=UPI002DD8E70F|nr:hypothetical protein [Streptomyces sp. NBC_01763]WSC34096.1 hypothetical protein OHA08_00005 [Streptomyces sp. NBC_01763]WSC41963.1 hypothetical protein OHA08_44975 [Streptomyces sp. NBC_01763]WSF81726.1 hypothetical protein OIE70_00005 [Streptomyces sp. NBC_01744]WSF89739.1 hypothetical protein OIE70_45925 [Streptomyces sp. NBC_01744]
MQHVELVETRDTLWTRTGLMSFYEYLPEEIARLGVTRKATGLALGQVQTHVRLSREREERAREGPTELLSLSELAIAVWEYLEWKRVAHVMTERQMPVYAPGQDPRVGRREEQQMRRVASDVAAAEQHGEAPVEMLRHRVYRIDAQQTGSLDEPRLTVHLMASSLSEAAHRPWTVYGRPAGPYRQGEYRITSVEQVLPEPGELF